MIRDATPADEAVWRDLWQSFLAYYKTSLDPAITTCTWSRLIDPASRLQMRVAEVDGTVLGFAIYHHHESTWVMGEDCYLEDLFVAPAARGKGLGRALILDLMAISRDRGWHRLYWHTDAGNSNARRLYESIVPADGHIRYRLPIV